MNALTDVETPTQQTPRPPVKAWRIALKRAPGILILLTLLSGIGVLVFYNPPRPQMLVSAVVWIAYDVFVGIGHSKRPKAKSTESQKSRLVHQLLFLAGLILLFVPVPGLTGHFATDTLTTAAVGLGIQIASTLFYFWSRSYLGRMWSGAISIMNDHQLVETGPYRLLRHPMYTAIFGMFIGTAIVSGQYHALIGVALGVLAYARKIPMEERVLREEFGEAYEAYRRKRWALVPWLY